MNMTETKELLKIAASLDSTMLPAEDRDLLQKIAVWSKALAKVDYEDALGAVYDHYRRDVTKSVSVGIIFQACQGSRIPTGEHGFTECNPLILAPTSDAWGGRYEVWCRRCGFENSAYCDTIGEAQLLRDHHQYTPPTFDSPEDKVADQRAQQIGEWTQTIAATTVIPADETVDWSESQTHRAALEGE